MFCSIYFLNPCEKFHHQIKKTILKIKLFCGIQQLTAFEISFRFSVKNFPLGIPKSSLKIEMTLIKNLYEIWVRWNKHVLEFFFHENQKLSETSFLILKYSGDSEKFCFRLIFFLFKFACRKNRENLHFFFTDRQN